MVQAAGSLAWGSVHGLKQSGAAPADVRVAWTGLDRLNGPDHLDHLDGLDDLNSLNGLDRLPPGWPERPQLLGYITREDDVHI